MNLRTLLSSLEKYDASGHLDLEVTGLAYDSRKVLNGYLFVALPGLNYHGSSFVPQAEAAGAVAVLSDRSVDSSLPQIMVTNPRLALAHLSNSYYKSPSNKLKLFGVTGTNGKTTSTFLLRSALEAAGMRCGLLGTVQYRGSSFETPASLTTPESLDLQQMLATMVSEGCQACVMEVSSHSLVQYRVAGCRFESAVFTNLTQDHLDFHNTMEEYYLSKKILFDNEDCFTATAVLNIDDPYGAMLFTERKRQNLPVTGYGFEQDATYRIVDWRSSPESGEVVIQHVSGKVIRLGTSLMARYNAYNICGVFAALHSCGISEDAIAAGVERMHQVPGRLEKIDYGQPFLIFIDYAHTEDALRQVLQTVRPYTKKKLTVLFGCGGERDRGKRPVMGRVAAELADRVVLTTDNPRSEQPQDIVQDILEGVRKTGNTDVHSILDRTEAIEFAVDHAEPGDTLLLAGKGHENYQIIGKEKLHFDEREVLAAVLSGRGFQA